MYTPFAASESVVSKAGEPVKMAAWPTASNVTLVGHVTPMLIGSGVLPVSPWYGVAVGGVQPVGTFATAIEPVPLPMGMPLTVYVPVADVVTDGSALEPDGVTVTVALATPTPPGLVATVPEIVPPGWWQVTVILAVAFALAVASEYGTGLGAVQLLGSIDIATNPLPMGTSAISYAPVVSVVTAGRAEAFVGVAITVTPATPPPRPLETMPESDPLLGAVGEWEHPLVATTDASAMILTRLAR